MAGYAAATAGGGKKARGNLIDDRQTVGAGPHDNKADNEAGQGFHGECSLIVGSDQRAEPGAMPKVTRAAAMRSNSVFMGNSETQKVDDSAVYIILAGARKEAELSHFTGAIVTVRVVTHPFQP